MKHIGLLIPSSNIVAERELYTRLIKDEIPDVAFHFARLKFRTPYGINEEKYTQELVNSIPETLKELERINVQKTAVLCTSAEIYVQHNNTLMFPLSSVVSYFKSLNRSHPIVITPYNTNIGDKIIHKLKSEKINVVKEIHLNIKTKEELMNFSNLKLIDLIVNQLDKNIDSICVLCTNFETYHIENQLETTFQIPFISSNKAIYYDLIK